MYYEANELGIELKTLLEGDILIETVFMPERKTVNVHFRKIPAVFTVGKPIGIAQAKVWHKTVVSLMQNKEPEAAFNYAKIMEEDYAYGYERDIAL